MIEHNSNLSVFVRPARCRAIETEYTKMPILPWLCDNSHWNSRSNAIMSRKRATKRDTHFQSYVKQKVLIYESCFKSGLVKCKRKRHSLHEKGRSLNYFTEFLYETILKSPHKFSLKALTLKHTYDLYLQIVFVPS